MVWCIVLVRSNFNNNSQTIRNQIYPPSTNPDGCSLTESQLYIFSNLQNAQHKN